MFRRVLIAASIGLAVLGASGCRTNKKVTNPIANVDSKQPDKVLFDRAMDAMKHNKFDVARVTLQTLINTYPDSEFIARAKLAIGDSWYAEGGSAAMTQAENEYKDFQTFFPNMQEAAEAQMKIAGIHYDEMEKPDRDFTHAKRAEDEYRQMILQYPDSPLIPKAKKRLMEVQEVLAEREFLIGRFYLLREDYPAAIARLKSMSDAYPLYSKADETLFMLGEAYESEAALIRKAPQLAERQKAAAIAGFEKDAVAAYSKIITRYPATDRVDAAKKKLAELHAPIPTPTPEAIAQNKAEEESRSQQTKRQQVMGFMRHHPDTSAAAKVGEPPLQDAPQTGAPQLVRNANAAMLGSTGGKPGALSIETTGKGPAPENQPVPRSDSGATEATPAAPVETGAPTPTAPTTSGGTSSTTDATSAAPAPAPARVNDAQTDTSTTDSQASATTSSSSTATAKDASGSSTTNTPDPSQDSSSKKKKKKGLQKLNPF